MWILNIEEHYTTPLCFHQHNCRNCVFRLEEKKILLFAKQKQCSSTDQRTHHQAEAEYSTLKQKQSRGPYINRVMCINSYIKCTPIYCALMISGTATQILRWHPESLDDGVPGTVSFSTVNSTHEEMAARVYSTLWLRRNESSDRLWGLMMAVTRYSE